MKNNQGVQFKIHQLQCFGLILFLLLSLFGCGNQTISSNGIHAPLSLEHEFDGDESLQKSIFVFLDGTKNTPGSETNVWKMYQRVTENKDPQLLAIYVEGVGSIKDAPITGGILGRGMEDRILIGFEFIAANYSQGDNIYIFGFSRGALQARALAGMISYAGLPKDSKDLNGDSKTLVNAFIEIVKKQRDNDHINYWKTWGERQEPPLSKFIFEKEQIAVQPAIIHFLGLWDTVPGSSLKNYGACKEKTGFVKKYLYPLLPGVDRGERYKTDTYPTIREIAHAVSIDEKRSKFQQLLVCPALAPNQTKIHEVWFPGAHADIGGGYEDSSALSDISFIWMYNLLSENYTIKSPSAFKGNPGGVAHWSIADFPANTGSQCIDRIPPLDAIYHKSYHDRLALKEAPVLWNNEVKNLQYPLFCTDIQSR